MFLIAYQSCGIPLTFFVVNNCFIDLLNVIPHKPLTSLMTSIGPVVIHRTVVGIIPVTIRWVPSRPCVTTTMNFWLRRLDLHTGRVVAGITI